MRRMGAWFLAAAMALTMGSCTVSNEAYYQRAQLYLGSGDFDTAAVLFSQLGEYADSADYALYCAGLDALEDGDLRLAKANLIQVDPFKSSARYLLLIEAATLEESGRLEEALSLYSALGSFEDSQLRARKIVSAIPERDMARAKSLMTARQWQDALDVLNGLDDLPGCATLKRACEENITRAAYDEASALYAQGRYEDAMTAFEAMGDTLDARARALSCRSAMYRDLEKDYASADMSSAARLIDRYANMADYLDSPARLSDLEARFLTNLRLLDAAYAQPYVRFGSYPAGESGAEAPLLWRVTGAEDATITLLCEQVIDAMPIASATDLSLSLTSAEEDAAASLFLPDQAQLTDLGDDELTCPATAYAIAQGVRHHSDGSAWWWLDDALPDSRHPIVWYNGMVLESGVAPEEPTVGVRPMLTLSLDEFTFTGGSGTPEDPFR